MDLTGPADVQIGPDGESPVHFSPRANIESLIESVQARSMASTDVRLGNKLAKPLTVEQPPSSLFTFAAIKPAMIGNHANAEKGQLQDRNNKLAAPGNIGQKDPSPQVEPHRAEKILNLSGSQDHADASLNNSVSAPKQTSSQSAALADRKSSDLMKVSGNGQMKKQAQIQSLQSSASSIDTPSLMKILAFTYHQEVKQQNDLISNLKSEYGYKVQELSAAMAQCQSLEQSIEELLDQANTMKAEVDSLKEQLTDAQNSGHAETEIVLQLKTIHGKLDAVLQERRKGHTESVELGKALGVIRQMADELRQYRSQAQKMSPQKIANAMASRNTQANAALPESPQVILSPVHATDGTSMQAPKQQPKIPETVTSNKDDFQRSHHPQQSGNHTAHNEEDLTEDIVEHQDDSLMSVTDPAIPNVSSTHAEIGRRGMNKFGKRKHTDTYSECSQTSERRKTTKPSLASSKMIVSTPSKKTCLRSASHSVNITETNSSQSRIEGSVYPSGNKDHATPTKGKPSRGQAGV